MSPYLTYFLSSWVLVSLYVVTGSGFGHTVKGTFEYHHGNQTCDYQHGFGGRFAVVGARGSNYQFALASPTTVSFVLPWLCYLCHQLPHIWIVWRAVILQPGYSNQWRWFNWALFKLNLAAIVVKFIQTNTTYDGMSAHLPLAFGIGTVAGMLACVYTMRIPTRGLLFGFGSRIQCINEAARFMRKWHGLYISFALVNDFWYHPFEATAGHQLGILNDALLLWQSTLIYTHAHRNKFWTLALELLVLPHSACIAFTRSNGVMAGQFGFGYLLILIMHQMHEAVFSRLQKVLLALTAVVAIGLTYSSRVLVGLPGTRWEDGKGFNAIAEIFYLPMLHFVASFLLLPAIYWMFKPWVSRIPNPYVRGAIAVPLILLAPFAIFFGAMMGIFSASS